LEGLLVSPLLISRADSVFHSTPTISVRLQFAVYAFQSCWEAVFNLTRAMLDYVPQVWVVELRVMHVVHLLGLQVYTDSFETVQQGEMAHHFSKSR
jgi:hypothetical protein